MSTCLATEFDYRDRVDELRCCETSWLAARRAELIREQRRLRVEELAVTRVLDERGALNDSTAGADGVSQRTVRETVETARALESLPRVAAAAHEGALSGEQLGAVAQLADDTTDAEWARRAPQVAPADLARLARTRREPTLEESRARYAARSLRMWWSPERGMLNLRGELPDLAGAKFEATITRMIERMRPPKGEAWDTRERRGADVLVALCDLEGVVEPAIAATKPLLVVEVPLRGPAEIAGIPLPEAMVEQLRASASIETTVVDDHGVPRVIGSRTSALSPKLARAILLRDGHCRVPGCEVRHGLEIHHLVPRSWGGSDDQSGLAAVCTTAGHHQMLVPHGPWALVGNPNRPDGIRLVRYQELTAEQARGYGLPPPPGRRRR